MQFTFGALSMVLFLLCVYGAYRAGQRSHKPVGKEVDEQEAHKAKMLKQGFQELMSYDVTKALKGKG